MKNFGFFIKNLFILYVLAIMPAFAYEDCIVTTNGRLTDIQIEHNDIIDVFPLITLTNDKNTLIVHPLKEGKSKFAIIKNKKDKFILTVSVSKDFTKIEPVEGFEIFTVDCPPVEFIDIDEPPGAERADNENYIKPDEPPILRGESR